MTMAERLNPYKIAPGARDALASLQKYSTENSLEPKLMELVKTRASQINGCAYCLAMHTRDARKMGESEDRLFLLDAWDEVSIYIERERAALAWTEAVTRVSDGHVPDHVYAEARKVFSEKELVDLTMAIIAINAWNRIAISFRAQPQLGGN
jgi:AhpD family alkylhydroperoxidase